MLNEVLVSLQNALLDWKASDRVGQLDGPQECSFDANFNATWPKLFRFALSAALPLKTHCWCLFRVSSRPLSWPNYYDKYSHSQLDELYDISLEFIIPTTRMNLHLHKCRVAVIRSLDVWQSGSMKTTTGRTLQNVIIDMISSVWKMCAIHFLIKYPHPSPYSIEASPPVCFTIGVQ